MIYLFTGNMGTGKTSRVVAMILNNEDGLFKMKLEDGTEVDRPLYFCHIDGLDKRKFNAHELTEEEIMSAPLRDIIPQGAVLIVDEAHYTYPVRASGRPVPPYIQELTELRHHGHTVILMTQHPSQLDVFVRNLVSKHTHLERKAVGMKQYSWYKCVTALDNPAAVTGVESSSWKPPKEAFKYYKSSSQHQKFKKKVPVAVWALVGIFAFMAWKGFNVYQIYQKGTGQQETQIVSTETVNQPEKNQVPENTNPVDKYAPELAASSVPEKPHLSQEDYEPRIQGMPHTAPLYDNLNKVVQSMPYPVACVRNSDKCTCYTDQGTPIHGFGKDQCIDFVQNGIYNPYKAPRQLDSPETINKALDGLEYRQESRIYALTGESPPNLMYDGYVEAGKQFQQRGGVVGGS
ncbi:hypothetical protein EGK75_08660 [Neisseria weixii]|uniref:Zona occludens toxin N-terminal domain-containing protein n=1 Tax=Neisseria weixii TaxID=1853276 RepID=A0A3N4MTY7_9NEIS|nr:zonular occludens toxin domain-containing protein [Neisseria weixii]RPD83140.1 hypothetical protein EGK74_13370 [Neisseria weixii]RPD86705.1 hypothetical protein EGK75_08660 [Neisseria weixii]